MFAFENPEGPHWVASRLTIDRQDSAKSRHSRQG